MNEQIIDGMTMTDIRDYIESWLDEAEPKLDRIEDLGQRMAERIAQLQAENERLRVELDDLKQQHADLCACHDEHYAGMIAAMAENERLRGQLETLDQLLEWRYRVIDAIPPCPEHGPQCLPHCLEWIKRARTALGEGE